MACRRPGDKPLSEPMTVSFLTDICVTRPQWVKWLILILAKALLDTPETIQAILDAVAGFNIKMLSFQHMCRIFQSEDHLIFITEFPIPWNIETGNRVSLAIGLLSTEGRSGRHQLFSSGSGNIIPIQTMKLARGFNWIIYFVLLADCRISLSQTMPRCNNVHHENSGGIQRVKIRTIYVVEKNPHADHLVQFSMMFPPQELHIQRHAPNKHFHLPCLTHWGRVTHICVSELTSIGSENGLSPGRRQAFIWTNAGILLIGPLGTNAMS